MAEKSIIDESINRNDEGLLVLPIFREISAKKTFRRGLIIIAGKIFDSLEKV